jgi:hypothetical protein
VALNTPPPELANIIEADDDEDHISTLIALPAERIPRPSPPPPPELEATLAGSLPPAQVAQPDFEDALTGALDPRLIGTTALADTQAQAPLVPAAQPNLAIPPAPYTPPPLRDMTRSTQAYSYPSNYFLEQRVAAYTAGDYEMISYTPYQVVMEKGKGLSFFWWLMALLSGTGFLWYCWLLLRSGFSKDRVYLIMERDGTFFEDGQGAVHQRRARAKAGRRWGFLGVVIFFLSLLWLAGALAFGIWAADTYQAELAAVYPDIELFQGASPADLSQTARQDWQDRALAYGLVTGLAGLSLWLGLSLTIMGYLHHAACDVRVLPLAVYE